MVVVVTIFRAGTSIGKISVMKLSLLLSYFLLGISCLALSQETINNEINATYLSESPSIDGIGDEKVWQNLPWAYEGTFTQFIPDNLEPSSYVSHIKLGYNNKGLYVFAKLDDPEPATIPRELGLRDEFGKASDRFALIIDTYNQGQNGTYFGVTAAGVQLDLFNSNGNEDVGWDAIYSTAVQFTNEGWQLEMEIPWSMLRFSKEAAPTWGFNMIREVRRHGRELATWNPMDAEIDGIINQSGKLKGIQNIEPPLRLQLYPYLSAVAGIDGVNNETNTNFGGGMDVKLGISESFTLDLTLIPDFSQVQADDQILNLGPFEVQYDENRPFFKEGTELFDRGNIFYSRRVGQVNRAFVGDVPDSIEIVSTPTSAKLINAFKVTGRTPKGLGIGVFNATTNKVISEALASRNANLPEYPDSLVQVSTEYVMDPVTNFNMVVLDQNFGTNSNFSVWNTNVNRADGAADGNVFGSDFRLRDKNNKYQVSGFFAQSNQYHHEGASTFRNIKRGYRYTVRLDKVSGNWQFGVNRNVESENYDINDLGILFFPNEVNHRGYLSYRIFKPFSIFNNAGVSTNVNYQRLKNPNEFQQFSFNVNLNLQFKNFWNFSTGRWTSPMDSYDFTEPRIWGQKFEREKSWHQYVWVGTNQQKRFYTDFELWGFRRPAWNAADWGLNFSPRYRFSNKLSVSARINYARIRNERGWAKQIDKKEGRHIIFGDRDIERVIPEVFVQYTMNDKMGLSGRVRLYRSRLAYDDLYSLNEDGTTTLLSPEFLQAEKLVASNFNRDFTTLNMELLYRWQVAPGSFLTASYVGFTDNFWEDERYQGKPIDFADNRFTYLQPMRQTVSLKLTYFVDYLMIKNLL